MKITKITLVLASIVFFTSFSFNAKARNCSDPQGFHEKMMCKVQGSKLGGSVESSSSDETKKVKKENKKSKLQEFNEKYKSLADIVPGLSKD